jgi:hypothetical protein
MQTAIHRSLAEGNVMFFGSGEVSPSSSPSIGWNNAKVAGNASLENDAGFGFAVSDHFFDIRAGNKSLHDLLGFPRGSNEIKIFDDLFAPAEAPSNFRLEDGWTFAEMAQESLGGGESVAQSVEFAVVGSTIDRFQKVCRSLLSKTIQGSQASIVAGFLKGFEGFDFQFFAESAEFLWAEAWKIEEG